MTETKNLPRRTANRISSLVSFLFVFLLSLQSIADGESSMDFGVSEDLLYFPQLKSTEFLFQGTANWVYEFSAFKSQTKMLVVGQRTEDFHRVFFDCTECYVQYVSGENTFRLGWQVIHWGLTDGYNPINRINTKAYFIPTHPLDQGDLMLNWSFTASDQQFQFLWMPDRRKTFLPHEESPWLPRRIYQTPGATNVQALIPEEFNYEFTSRESIDKADKNNLAFQWSLQKEKFEATLNYFDGMAAIPLFNPTITGTVIDADPDHTVIQVDSDLKVRLTDFRVQSGGGSFLWNFDSFIFKWEGLLTQPVGDHVSLPPRIFEQVAAIEKNWNVGATGMLTTIFQYSHVNTPEPAESRTFSILSFFEQAGMLGIRYNWKEKWTLTGFSAVDFKNHASFNELSLTYATDKTEYTLSGTSFDGTERNLIGLWRDNDFAAFSFKWLF